MRNINDTISAISSASISGASGRSIIRMSGSDALEIAESMFQSDMPVSDRSVTAGCIAIDDELRIEAKVYYFQTPRSYTGQDLVEIHISTAEPVMEKLLSNILQQCRLCLRGCKRRKRQRNNLLRRFGRIHRRGKSDKK